MGSEAEGAGRGSAKGGPALEAEWPRQGLVIPRSQPSIGGWTVPSILEVGALWAVMVFSGAAVLGFASFGMNPELLARYPSTIPFYTTSYRLFSIGQILLAGGALMVLLLLRSGIRWIPLFLSAYFIGLGTELSGTAFGFPFGPYEYTGLLGPRWFDLVPLVIPLSWFLMAVPSFHLALRIAPGVGMVGWVVLGALFLTAWDLALDPAMSYATVYWRWEVDGAYYGMPWINLFGWIFTSVLIMGSFIALGAHRWLGELPTKWMVSFYAANVLLALGMAAAAGLVWAVLLTLTAYLALWALARSWQGRAVASARSGAR